MRKILIRLYCNIKLLLSPFHSKIKILKDTEMVKYIKNNNLSVIRFGDGEFRIIEAKKGIHYQDYDSNLRKEMAKLLYSYDCNSKYMLSIPYFFNEDIFWYKRMPCEYTMCFARYRLFFRKKYNKDMVYGDAFLFRKGNKAVYEKLWNEEKEILLIHNDVKWAKKLESEYNIKVNFMQIPSKNSYDIINELEKQIINDKKNKNLKILISGGPMAKALSYRLSSKGYIIYDTGHCFDEPLELEVNRK